MIIRTDPFREFDRLTQQLLGATGTKAHPAPMPMDAYRDGDTFFLHFDVPGMDPGSLGLNVERNMLTVSCERKPIAPEQAGYLVAERPNGAFSRQVFLGDSLDTERIAAHYDAGVLTVTIPVAEKAKPRRVEITAAGKQAQLAG
jgi:HSP20 family protein